jgi:hypothetical protein
MGNVIPWSQIHPSITSQEPFVAVVIIDPQRQICVSEMVPFEPEALANPDVSASEVIAAAQTAAARVASGYRTRRKETGAPSLTLPTRESRDPDKRKQGREKLSSSLGLRVLDGGKS